MIQPFFLPGYGSEKMTISTSSPKDDARLPIYDDPDFERDPEAKHVSLLEFIYVHLLRAYAHFCFEKSNGEVILTGLGGMSNLGALATNLKYHPLGRYFHGHRTMVLHPPTVFAVDQRYYLLSVRYHI